MGAIIYNLLNTIVKEVNYVINKPSKGIYLFIGSIFTTLCLLNFLAIFPHLFSATSHILVTLPFSYIFWLSVIRFIWIRSFTNFLSHLIPVGTPIFLIRFIVIVEILRNFIRPLALTFRLTANIIAGHLLISLIGGAIIKLPVLLIILSIPIKSILVFIELGVSIIQAYVFSTLILLYISEGL